MDPVGTWQFWRRHLSRPSRPSRLADPQYTDLRWRLLLSYLGVMLAILGISAIAIYGLFVKSLYQQIDDQLGTLADAAAHSLEQIQTQQQQPTASRSAVVALRPIDADGDLDLAWHTLRQPNQGIEWFNPDRQLLAYSGKIFSTKPLQPRDLIVQRDGLRSLSVPVYTPQAGQQRLTGYVRVHESVELLEAELSRLRWGLGLGGLVGLGLIGISSIWLTRQSLKPVRHTLRQLQQFTSDASHELRTPLTAVKMNTEILQSHPERLHPDDQRKVEAIAAGIEQMRHLVNDLLWLTRLDPRTVGTQEWRLLPCISPLQPSPFSCMPQAVEAAASPWVGCLSKLGCSLRTAVRPAQFQVATGQKSVQSERVIPSLASGVLA